MRDNTSNQIIKVQFAVPEQIVDNWNAAIEPINPTKGYYTDEESAKNSNEDVRSCEVRYVTIQQKKLYQDIFNNVFQYVDYYCCDFNVNIYRKLEIQHTTYNVGGHYIPHIDANFNDSRQTQRKISMVLMLSSPTSYGGGELTITKKPFKEEKGTLILFRPTLTHSVQKVTSGVRKSLVMWVHGPAWR